MLRLATASLLSVLATSAGSVDSAAPEPRMIDALEHVTIFVRDYDEALGWYVGRLGLVKVEDQRFGSGERWLTVAPSPTASTRIVLAVPRATLTDSIGHQHNWVFRTADCRATHAALAAKGVTFVQEPRDLPWGCRAIIEDLYGNRIVLRGKKG